MRGVFNLRLLSFMLIVFIGSSLVVSSTMLTLGYKISILDIIVSFGMTLIFTGWSLWKSGTENLFKNFVGQTLMFMAIFAASMLVAGYFYDLSCDGQVYHQEAVIQLAEGWNPLIQELPESVSGSLWINHYSKGPWIYETMLYKFFGKIEYSKAFNIVLIISVFLLSFSVFMELQNNKIKAFFTSFVVSFNPVSVNQSLSFYIDGQLASLFALSVLLIYLIIYKKYDTTTLIVMMLSLVLLINIKFTGLVYAVFLSGGLIVLGLKDKREKLKSILTWVLLSFIIGIFLVGYNPYVTNTVEHGHPFYPLYNSSVDIISPQAGEEYLSKNRFEQLFISVFAGSQDVYYFSVPKLKWPFTVSKNEFKAFISPDTRTGGFGPLFGGAVLITVLTIFISFIRNFNKAVFMFAIILSIFISVVVNPVCWWARYAPQLWLIPVITAILSLYLYRDGINKWLGILIISILSFNLILTTGPYLAKQYVYGQALKNQLAYLKESSQNNMVYANFGTFQSNRVRLKEAEVKFQTVSNLREPKVQMVSSETMVSIKEEKVLQALKQIKDYTVKLKSF